MGTQTITDIRSAYYGLRKKIDTQQRTSDYWGCDRIHAVQYFDSHPKWSKIIQSSIASVKGKEGAAVYVDICGRATGDSLGTTKSFSFSKQKADYHYVQQENEVRFDGNIFSRYDFNNFLKLLRNEETKPFLVTFEPVAGLQYYSPVSRRTDPEYYNLVHRLLEAHLRKIVECLHPEGYIFLGPAFQLRVGDLHDFLSGKPQKEYESALQIKKLCRSLKCSVLVDDTDNGPRFLIHPWKSKNH